ncbi:MAG: hypothetical protein FJ293_02505 [Planctomycetes bacterium]|nr:hypothetical protein [Planctomycetota bacterium]
MRRILECGRAAAALLALAACAPLRMGDGGSYSVGGDPWAPSTERGGGTVADKDGAAKSGANGEPAAAPKGGSDPAAAATVTGVGDAPIGGAGTVLEQLDAARRRSGELDQENRRLSGEVAALTAVVDQLKRDNANLAQLAQQSQESRAVVDGELENMTARIKDLELRSRQLADDLLAERIKRVRIERQLILAKVAEAESASDGP